MKYLESSLKIILSKIHDCGALVKVKGTNIAISIQLVGVNLLKIKPFLYLLLNNLESAYFITIEGIPYCLMPDAAEHIIYTGGGKKNYTKHKCCQECKYADICPGWPKNTQKILPRSIKELPKEIILEITGKCNLRCQLCFNKRDESEMPFGKIKNVIDECSDLSIKSIRFTGGEPLLHSNIEEILKYAKYKNLYVILNTNATFLDKRIKKLMKNYVDNILISMQGFNPASERKLTRSKINFLKKIRNIIELNRIVPVVRIGSIISRTLVKNFYKYFYIIEKANIKNWELYRPMIKAKNEEYIIKHDDFIKVMYAIQASKKHGKEIKIANSVPFCITENMSLSRHTLLGSNSDDGHSRMVLDTKLFFKPSYFIKKNLGVKIEAAWKSHFLKKIRSLSYLPAECRRCYELKWCKGGSRHWAKIANKSYFARDPLMKNA